MATAISALYICMSDEKLRCPPQATEWKIYLILYLIALNFKFGYFLLVCINSNLKIRRRIDIYYTQPK